MEISLEKIELVKDRTGVSYKEAKEALEKTDGDVIEAIIYIEESAVGTDDEDVSSDKKALIDRIKEMVKKGNVTKIQFKKGDDVIMNIPVTAGAIGTVIFPLPALTAAVVALAAKCSVQIVKDNGEIVDLNEKSGGRIDDFRDKAEDFVINFGEKAGDAFGDMRVKAEDAYENIKYKAAERKEKKRFCDEECFEFDDIEECEGCCDCEYDCSDDCDVVDEKPESEQE